MLHLSSLKSVSLTAAAEAYFCGNVDYLENDYNFSLSGFFHHYILL